MESALLVAATSYSAVQELSITALGELLQLVSVLRCSQAHPNTRAMYPHAHAHCIN